MGNRTLTKSDYRWIIAMNAAVILCLVAGSLGQNCYRLPSGQKVCPQPGQVSQRPMQVEHQQEDEGDAIPHGSFSQAVVEVVNNYRPDRGSGGSGVILRQDNGKALVLTARHVFLDGPLRKPRIGKIRVVRSDGTEFVGRHLLNDTAADLAAVEIDLDEADFTAPAIADHMPDRDPVWLIGFGMSRHLHAHQGRYQGISGKDAYYKMGIDHGDSGGAIFNNSGELIDIGVAFVPTSYDPSRPAVGVALPQIKRFLRMPACFKFFKRQPININIDNNNAEPGQPATTPPLSTVTPPASQTPAPAPSQPASAQTPVDLAPLTGRVAALEADMANVKTGVANLTTTAQNLVAITSAMRAELAKGFVFQTPNAAGGMNPPVTKHLGDTVTISPLPPTSR